MTAAPGDASWRTTAERGSILGIRVVLFLATTLGRGPARLLMRALALYYTLSSPAARAAVRSFLAAAGEPVTFARVYRQILRFTQVTLDALFLVAGKTHLFRFERHGHEHLEALRREGRGALLLGAHLGSFHAMRAHGGEHSLPVYAVVYTKHAQRINRVLEELDPSLGARLLRMGEGVDFVLRIRELIEQGALVAILGDRVGADDRTVEAEFFGRTARFPTGPYILAAALKCPVYLTFGLYRDPDRYELHCEPFAERVELPRRDRQAALARYAQQYAARLEHYCRSAPDNWFNFYDFWA